MAVFRFVLRQGYETSGCGGHAAQSMASCWSALTWAGVRWPWRATGQLVWPAGPFHIWIKEGKTALVWTRLPCRGFDANAVRLQLHTLAYNLANFMRTLALPQEVKQWSLTTLRDKLVKIGAKVVRHGRYVTFQLAEVAVPRTLFAEILRLIEQLRPKPAPT